MILAIDTSSDFASIAVLDAQGRCTVATMHSDDGHAHNLFQQIEALLAHAGVTLAEIDVFAAASGPGSFTGVRVALSAAKGLAEAAGKPMVAVSTLQALAWFGTSSLRAPYMDARRSEVFAGLYDASLQPLAEEIAGRFEEWKASLPPGAELIANDPPRELARAVAHIARQSPHVDPAAVDANYVRRSDAELKWTDK